MAPPWGPWSSDPEMTSFHEGPPILLDFLPWGRDSAWSPVCPRPWPGPRPAPSVWSLGTYVLEDRVCGRLRVVAVDEEALVHSDDPAALPEVAVEEEQVLGHTLQAGGEASTVAASLLTAEMHPCPMRSVCTLTQVTGDGNPPGVLGRPARYTGLQCMSDMPAPPAHGCCWARVTIRDKTVPKGPREAPRDPCSRPPA